MEAAAGEPKTTPEELRAAIERLLISKREGVQRHREYGRALGTAEIAPLLEYRGLDAHAATPRS